MKHQSFEYLHDTKAQKGQVMRLKIGNKTFRYMTAFLISILAVLLLFILNICIGSVRITLPEIIKILAVGEGEETMAAILWDIRLPRAVAALILGGALSLAGYLLQTFFHNPIAGPFVLGISSGAKMTVAIVMVFLMGKSFRVSSGGLILAAFVGAMLSMGFVLLMSYKVNNMSMLVISGVMIGYICSAVTELIVTFAEDAEIVNLHSWSRGSFSGMTWENVQVMALVVFMTFLVVFLMSKPLFAYQMGDAYAQNVGVNLHLLRINIVIFSSILSACVVAFAGPVSFVGIAVPHLTKRLFGTAQPIVMIPSCFLGGSIFCLFCDLLARTMFAPTELGISTVTAIFGAPVVLYIMAKRKKR